VSVVREPNPIVQGLTGQRCHSGCWKVARASKRFIASWLASVLRTATGSSRTPAARDRLRDQAIQAGS
jgi:hypothetical protein